MGFWKCVYVHVYACLLIVLEPTFQLLPLHLDPFSPSVSPHSNSVSLETNICQSTQYKCKCCVWIEANGAKKPQIILGRSCVGSWSFVVVVSVSVSRQLHAYSAVKRVFECTNTSTDRGNRYQANGWAGTSFFTFSTIHSWDLYVCYLLVFIWHTPNWAQAQLQMWHTSRHVVNASLETHDCSISPSKSFCSTAFMTHSHIPFSTQRITQK